MPTLIPPKQATGAFSDGIVRGRAEDLWRFYGFDQGIALVKRNGSWTTATVVNQDLDDEYYQGGMVHIIDQAKADELTAAGFGAYIDATPGDPTPTSSAYGSGPYGSGPYGGA